jgi:hypothetical protein
MTGEVRLDDEKISQTDFRTQSNRQTQPFGWPQEYLATSEDAMLVRFPPVRRSFGKYQFKSRYQPSPIRQRISMISPRRIRTQLDPLNTKGLIMRVGFIGLGTVGGNAARNIMRRGFELVVHDIREEEAQPLIKEGAELGESPADVVSRVDVVVTMVFGPEQIPLSWNH